MRDSHPPAAARGALVAALLLAALVFAQVSQHFDASWALLSGGGGLRVSLNHEIHDALGQSFVQTALGAAHRIEPGFLPGDSTEGESPAEGEGTPEGGGDGEGGTEGAPDGEGTVDGEGGTEGDGEGHAVPDIHSADQNGDGRINLSELLRVIQFYNSGGYHCADPPGSTEDGYTPGPNPAAHACFPHTTDYNPQDWSIALTELLRLIQFYNSGGYHPCATGEDGYCPGL